MAALANVRTALALAIAVISLGAGAFAIASTGAEDDGVFKIELRDGSIGLEGPVGPGGRQVLEVANEGTAEHEVVVLRTQADADEIPVGLHGVSPSMAGRLIIGEDHAAAGHTHRPGVVLGLLPGTSRRYQVELGPGRYVVLCQTANHYLTGERMSFEVR
jgi:hypothetical protein